MAPRPTTEPAFAQLLHPRHWPTWLGLGLLRLLSLLPLPLAWVCGGLLGELLHLHKKRRHIARRNLERCFPEFDAATHARLARRHFRALGASFLTAGVGWWASEARLARLMHVRNREHYDRALAEERSIILLAPHFLGLEIGGIWLSRERIVVSMYQTIKNPLFDLFVRRGRCRFDAVLIEHNAELRPIIRHLREGKPFYYLPDQDPGRKRGIFAPFFGIPTATTPALSRFAQLADAVVIPCFTRLLPWGRGWEIGFRPPLADFPSDDTAADTARMNAEIEAGIRETPEQYFWVHRRFKTRPEGEGDFYV